MENPIKKIGWFRGTAILGHPPYNNHPSSIFLDTLWWTNIAIENGGFIVDFPIKNGDFPLLC